MTGTASSLVLISISIKLVVTHVISWRGGAEVIRHGRVIRWFIDRKHVRNQKCYDGFNGNPGITVTQIKTKIGRLLRSVGNIH